MFEILSNSSKKTKETAGFLAGKFFKKPPRDSALVIALTGGLGAGKTAFVQGFLKAAGVKKRITSPTFVLIKNYPIAKLPRFHRIYHIDCYRLDKPEEISKLNFEEIAGNPQNIILIEWADRIKKVLPKNAIWIKLEYGKKENERKIVLVAKYKKDDKL